MALAQQIINRWNVLSHGIDYIFPSLIYGHGTVPNHIHSCNNYYYQLCGTWPDMAASRHMILT